MMNGEDKVEPTIKEEPKHYSMELAPGKMKVVYFGADAVKEEPPKAEKENG